MYGYLRKYFRVNRREEEERENIREGWKMLKRIMRDERHKTVT